MSEQPITYFARGPSNAKCKCTLAAIGALTVASGILAALWWLLSHVQWVP